MSFVSIGGSLSSTPTFLELIAVQRIDRSIRDAFSYCISAIAARHHGTGLWLLQYDNELHLALRLIIEGASLISSNSSFAESLYGLKRVAGRRKDNGGTTVLRPSERVLSLFFLALAPYLQTRFFGDGGHQITVPSMQLQHHGITSQLTHWWREHRGYAHMATGACQVAYQLLYLLDVTQYFSPALHLSGVVLRREDGQQTDRKLVSQSEMRRRVWDNAVASKSLLGFASWSAIRVGHLLGNHAKAALLFSLILFKALEWWWTSGEEQLQQASRKIPPAPPTFQPHCNGIHLPEDPALCPLCKRTRTGPAMVATSGYVYCYKCIYPYINHAGRCPVTHIGASLNDIRRLFFTS